MIFSSIKMQVLKREPLKLKRKRGTLSEDLGLLGLSSSDGVSGGLVLVATAVRCCFGIILRL